MTTRLPTAPEIAQLTAYLPLLYADGFAPVLRWHGGTQYADGVWRLPWPEYDPLVVEFFGLLGAECWLDYEYDPQAAWRTLQQEDAVARASLAEIKTLLTFCLRGERFADGHRAEMIEQGHIRRLLTRLQQLQDKGAGD